MKIIQEGITMEELTAEERKHFKDRIPGHASWIRVMPFNQIVPRPYYQFSEKIRQFQFREKDVVFISYPKTGSTWMGEILWAMTNIHQLHLAEEIPILERIYFLYNDIIRPVKEGDQTPLMKKFRSQCPKNTVDDGVVLSLACMAPDRRILRSHLLPQLLHPDMFETCKVVYLVRNPKDTCASRYNYLRASQEYPVNGTLEEFFELFTSGVFPFGCYWDHLRHMLEWKDHPNLHIVYYEDLKKDHQGELEKLNKFCDFKLSRDQLTSVSEHASLPHMKRREVKLPYVGKCKNGFFGKGKVGGWMSLATPDLDRRMDAWIDEKSKELDIDLKYG